MDVAAVVEKECMLSRLFPVGELNDEDDGELNEDERDEEQQDGEVLLSVSSQPVKRAMLCDKVTALLDDDGDEAAMTT